VPSSCISSFLSFCAFSLSLGEFCPLSLHELRRAKICITALQSKHRLSSSSYIFNKFCVVMLLSCLVLDLKLSSARDLTTAEAWFAHGTAHCTTRCATLSARGWLDCSQVLLVV
jgi:hypothetical protein